MKLYKVQNKKNLHFIQQFIREDLEIDLKKNGRPELLDTFVSSVNEANLASVGVLNKLNEQLLVSICFSTLLEGEEVSFNTDGNRTVSENVKSTFKELLLDIGRTEVEYNMSESGRITFNKKHFAEIVMDFYPLVVDRNDPDILLVYNKEKGFWEDARQPLHRLIIEVAHAAGGNTEDTWTSHLESSILDILRRKVAFVQSANFNKNYFPLGNLTLDSTTGDLVPHAPSHLATYGSPVN